MRIRTAIVVASIALFNSACSGGGSGSGANFSVLFEAPGGSASAASEVVGLPFSSILLQDVTLPPGVVVNGMVTDEFGAALAGASVKFLAVGSETLLDQDATDGAGNYQVRMHDGTWCVQIDSNDNSVGTLVLNSVVVSSPGPQVLNFQFAAKMAVGGIVSEAFGPVIPGAQVEFTGAATDSKVSVTADGAGVYAAMLIPDTYTAKVTPVAGAALTHLEERFPGNIVSGVTTLNFDLTAGVTVSGTVLANNGMPLLEATDIEVNLASSSNFSAPAKVTSNAVDGTYSIGPVPPGSISFRFEAPDDSGFPRQDMVQALVAPSQSVDFMLSAGFVLSGTILQDDGISPEPGVDVDLVATNGSLAPNDDNTNGSGFYEVSVFPGTYSITFSPNGANQQLVEIQQVVVASNTTFDLTLVRGVMISGTVSVPGGATPAPDIEVSIEGVLGASATTDGAGMYSFLAPVGMHDLLLTGTDGTWKNFAIAPEMGVTVSAPGPLAHNIEFSLAVTGSTLVTGMVFESDGITPAVGSDITAYDALGEVLGRAISLVDGTYILVLP